MLPCMHDSPRGNVLGYRLVGESKVHNKAAKGEVGDVRAAYQDACSRPMVPQIRVISSLCKPTVQLGRRFQIDILEQRLEQPWSLQAAGFKTADSSSSSDDKTISQASLSQEPPRFVSIQNSEKAN